MITIAKRHLELKIGYFRYRLKQVAHGYFSICRGHRCVYVTYDPNNSHVTRINRHRYYTSSPKGKEYTKQIEEYIMLKAKLEDCLKTWRATYICEPRDIKFPLRKIRPDPISLEFFENAMANENVHQKGKLTHNLQYFRSKNEIIGAQIMEALDYLYKTEVLIRFDQFSYVCPDLMFYVPEIEKVLILEIDGAIDSSAYNFKSFNNTTKMMMAGLVEGKDFIVVRIADSSQVDAELIKQMVLSAIEASINDIYID